jgi:hypothetical protein
LNSFSFLHVVLIVIQPQFEAFEVKMKAHGLSVAAISAFKSNYDQLVAGVTGFVPESEITAASDLPFLTSFSEATPESVQVRESRHNPIFPMITMDTPALFKPCEYFYNCRLFWRKRLY